MRALSAILTVTLFLPGCATVHESYAPDGRKAYALNCSGTARGWDKCYTAAGEICSTRGYDILDRNTEDVGIATASGNSAAAVKTNERTMLIACKAK